MKTLQFNRNSWHFKLVNTLFGYSVYEIPDICSYTRAVLFSLFLVTLFAILIAFGVFLIGDFLGYLIASILNFTFIEPENAAIVVMMLLFISSIFGIGYLIGKFSSRTLEKVSDSFIAESYKSFKGKYCAKIEFVNKE